MRGSVRVFVACPVTLPVHAPIRADPFRTLNEPIEQAGCPSLASIPVAATVKSPAIPKPIELAARTQTDVAPANSVDAATRVGGSNRASFAVLDSPTAVRRRTVCTSMVQRLVERAVSQYDRAGEEGPSDVQHAPQPVRIPVG